MKSMKAKTKTKRPNGKFGKVKFSSKEVTPIDPDLSQLRPPIITSVSTLYRVNKVLENGSDEIRSILAYECDLVYECRVCRSLFRSLVNFISHKRIYCKEKFDVTFARNSSNDYDTIFKSKLDIINSEKITEEACGNDRILRSQVSKGEQKKDLTAIVSMLQRKQVENSQTHTGRLYLETMNSNSSAVYQTVESNKNETEMVSTEHQTDLMKAQVMELKDIKEQTAVLGLSGQILQPSQKLNNSTSTQIHNDEKINIICDNELICPICHAKFSTKKTLAVHTRTLHTSHRLCYPCPCCSSTFANTWSVYRHLFKVHRKSNEQVRKLRSQIQEKAFIKNTTAAEDLQEEDANKTLMSNGLGINETQEWMDHLESDTELQRCGGCGKRFDRKAALSSHSQYCHRRVAAYENTTKVRKINKVSSDIISNENIIKITDAEVKKNDVVVKNSLVSSEINNSNETSIRVEAIASLSKADWDMLGNEDIVPQDESIKNVTTGLTNPAQGDVKKDDLTSASDISDTLEIVYTNINKHKSNVDKVGSKKRKNKDSAKKLDTNTENIAKDIPVEINADHDIEAGELNHVLLMEKKVASIVNFQKLQCLPCKRKFTSVNNLRRHAAIHIGWNRYQCKLCNYKCFVKCDCVAHCNKMHSAQNNRAVIDGMIIQIPNDQYTCDQNVTYSITNLEKEIKEIEVIEVSISPEHVETDVQEDKESINETETETEAEVVDIDPVTASQELIHVNGESEKAINNADKLGLDPDLRRMVMEVIFGSSEVNSTKEEEIKNTVCPQNSDSKLQNKEIETRSMDPDLKNSDIVSVQDSSKPQRPIRNKMKPLNKDFIYDLKDVTFRKDSLIIKPFNKQLAKKSLVQEEDSLEKNLEQPFKRFKSIQDDEISVLCENGVMNKCDININRNLKNSLTFSQCHS